MTVEAKNLDRIAMEALAYIKRNTDGRVLRKIEFADNTHDLLILQRDFRIDDTSLDSKMKEFAEESASAINRFRPTACLFLLSKPNEVLNYPPAIDPHWLRAAGLHDPHTNLSMCYCINIALILRCVIVVSRLRESTMN